MRPNIPSLMSLLAFEAASRHLSFTSAAQELELTQTAISHQIKNLEERLGTKLFIRRRNELQLTPYAREYLESVREAIAMLSMATKRATGERTKEVLSISCPPTYAIKCLLPTLPSFQRAHPEIIVQLFASSSFELPKRKALDVAIRYGTGRWPAFHVDRLHGEEFFPVCSPRLLKEVGAGSMVDQLSRMTQIRTFPSSTQDDEWRLWLEAAGIKSIEFSGETIFNLHLLSIQAAADGAGIAIGRTPIVNADLAGGTLIAPFGLRLEATLAYYIVTPADKVKLDKVRAFREWALERLHE